MIGTNAHILAGSHGRATLANQNVAGENVLPAEAFDAEALGMRVPAVLGAAACLLVCHVEKTSFNRR
jgi:hypothetical protein